ncbi:YjbF family lipoprotein [Thetidibacter halocola]|uniref:YjbF family lipoprotein n=1 Tax=Thetidibacter halocola TaxID=2827239 RepID=A0A8J7WE17_9RHOB|nr:YjbF family lipoprotein [Thetidibacter halocola]MBS0123641.1 YjbF family lipoprotein [Thetidibacter halocola]
MTPRMLRPVAALALALVLAACGSEQQTVNPLNALKAIPQVLSGQRPAPPQVSAEQVAAALRGTNGPLLLVQQEQSGAQVLFTQIERNGPYATYGNAARQAVVLRKGLITSSRGLGGDLMSTQSDWLLARVSARQPARRVPYILRFLTPEDETRVITVLCDLTLGQSIEVKGGTLNTRGTAVNASCAGSGVSFSDTYVVGANGTILSSRQWLGPTLGHVATQALRL